VGKLKNNQSGFTVVEVLLLLIFLAIIGFIGVYVAHNRSGKPVAVSSSTSKSANSSKSTAAPDPYIGWKQYCSAHEKSCFKYPSNWTFTDNCGSAYACQDMDNVTITSPSKSTVGFTSSVTGRGGDCAGAQDSFITTVTPLPKASGLYIVQFSRADVDSVNFGVDDKVDGAIPKTGDTGACFMYTQFAAKNTVNAEASLDGSVPNSAKAADLSDALLILKSYYYQ
jgi:hypothetical protein